MTIELIQGGEADRLLGADAFRDEWTALLRGCPWGTAFQSPGFAGAWYGAYRDRYEPLLVVSRGAGGRLDGLLPLAATPAGDDLVVAGAHQAEYHAWICPPDAGDDFPRHALRAVRRLLPGSGLRFRYLPPNTPRGWLASAEARSLCLLKAHPRPLMRFGDGKEIAESLAKGSNKSRLRRMEKLGRTEFKRVTDPVEFEALFDEIIGSYDTRRMAINGVAPFRADPCKRPFHSAMMRVPGLLHATVLKVGDRVAAAHIGACGQKEVQLGINAHSPFLAKHSPGKFHILFLARMLMQEGYEQLDLTAGGDPYKERFANAWDEVHTLGVFPTPARRVTAAVRGAAVDSAKTALTRYGVTPARAGAVVETLKRVGPAGIPAAAIRRAGAWVNARRETGVYVLDVARARPAKEPVDADIRRDALDDLLAYEPPDKRWPSRRAFVSAALERLEAGQRLYTIRADDGRLAHYAWLCDRPGEEVACRALPGYPLPADTALILDWCTLPGARGRGLGSRVLAAMVRGAAEAPKTKNVVIALPAGEGPASGIVEKLGFRFDRSLVEVVRFGRRRRDGDGAAAAVTPAPPPVVAPVGRSKVKAKPELVLGPQPAAGD